MLVASRLDLNKDGAVDGAELGQLLKDMGLVPFGARVEDMVGEVMRDMGVGEAGTLSLEAFRVRHARGG